MIQLISPCSFMSAGSVRTTGRYGIARSDGPSRTTGTQRALHPRRGCECLHVTLVLCLSQMSVAGRKSHGKRGLLRLFIIPGLAVEAQLWQELGIQHSCTSEGFTLIWVLVNWCERAHKSRWISFLFFLRVFLRVQCSLVLYWIILRIRDLNSNHADCFLQPPSNRTEHPSNHFKTDVTSLSSKVYVLFV